MRRTHLRGHPNILKRLLIHVAGFNLALVMRKLLGVGKPRGLTGVAGLLWQRFSVIAWHAIGLYCLLTARNRSQRQAAPIRANRVPRRQAA